MNDSAVTAIRNRSIFITGAASGIGKATAQHFAGRGWFVGLCGRDADKLDAVRASLGEAHSSCHLADVTDHATVIRALEEFVALTGGKLDVLVNNAGVLQAGNFEDIPVEVHHRIVDANLNGVINCCHAALPYLKATPGARVINMSSASAMFGSPSLASYSASKFGVRAITEALSVEWQRFGITVSDVMPPFVETDMLNPATRSRIRAISLLGVNLTPEDVARKVWEVVHSGQLHARMTLPFKLMALGQKHAPERIQQRMVKILTGY